MQLTYILVVIVTMLWQSALLAGTVGAFNGVRNLPGYIELQHRSDPVYRNRVPIPGRDDGVERRTASRILHEDYLQHDGTVNITAIDKMLATVRKHDRIAFLTYCVTKLPPQATHIDWCKHSSDTEINKRWRRRKLALTYAFVIEQLQRARALAPTIQAKHINNASSQAFLEHLFQALETFSSIKEQDPAALQLSAILRYQSRYLAPLRINNPHEAANLVIPAAWQKKYQQLQTQIFFSPRQLQQFTRVANLDISTLDPLDSGFWRKPHSVRNFDTSNYNDMSGFPPAITDPQQEIAVMLDWGGKFTGLTPKMRVYYGDWRWKMKYLSRGEEMQHSIHPGDFISSWKGSSSEVNTETVVNNLAAALGFTVDPTFFKNSVRLYLPLDDPTDAEEFARARQRLLREQKKYSNNPEQALADVNTDARGHWYIRMHSVSLERRSDIDTDMSVGSYNKGAFSRPLKREFRAFAVFSAWIADIDIKDDNANLVLVGNQAEGYRVVYSAADMGAALGSIFNRDSPNFLARDLVQRVRRRPNNSIYEVVLNYRQVMGNLAYQAISLNDAKWITRLIAQLSPTQIKNAFLAAGYSEMLSEYFTQIMLRRRDQLVETFGLLDETISDAAGNRILIKRISKMTDPDNYAVAGYEQFFRNGYLHDPQGLVASNPSDFIRRYYDRDLKNATRGTLQHALWESMLALFKLGAINTVSRSLQKIPITNRTFGLPLLDGDFCSHECFYDGLRIGISSFLPTRMLFKNPYAHTDTAKPLLVADIYRFGFLLGADIGEDYPARFGIDAKLNDNMPQARYQRVYEFIKLKGADSNTSAAENLKKLNPLQILQHRRIDMQMLENLQKNEALIVSTYISRALELRFGGYDVLTRPLLSSGFDLERITVGRKAIIKDSDGRLYLQFSDLRSNKFALGIKGEILLHDFPIISLELQKLTRADLLYEFDNTPEHLQLIKENLVSIAPTDSISAMAVATRHIETSNKKFHQLFNFANFFFAETGITSISLTADEQQRELHVATVRDGSSKKKRWLPLLKSSRTLLRSFVTDDEQVFVTLDMYYKSLLANRKHFAWVYKNMLPLLGKPFILFTPADVNWYLKSFSFHGRVFILPAGIEKIMAATNIDEHAFCVSYARAARKNMPNLLCKKLLQDRMSLSNRNLIRASDERRLYALYRNYRAAQHIWEQHLHLLSAAERSKLLRDKAQKIARLFATGHLHPTVWRMLQEMAGEENIHRDAKLSSRLGAFPAQRKVIKMPRVMQGKAGEKVEQALNKVVQSVEIFTDPLFDTLQEVFYTPMGEDIVPSLREID